MPDSLASRILWALDPVQDERSSIEGSVPFLKGLAGRFGKIFPISVLGPGAVNFPMGDVGNRWLQEYESAARKRLMTALSGIDLPGLQGPEILVAAQTTYQQALHEFLSHAKRMQIDLIVMRSHLRSGISRQLFGSFGDELLAQSTIPVMVIDPEKTPGLRMETVFFPTDFSMASRNAFRTVVMKAKNLKAKVVLFHALSRLVDPLLESGGGFSGNTVFPIDPSFYMDHWRRQRRRARGWAQWAAQQGVRVELVVENFALSVADSIVKVSGDCDADLIAMSFDQHGTIPKHLLHATGLGAPLWIFHHYRDPRKNPDIETPLAA